MAKLKIKSTLVSQYNWGVLYHTLHIIKVTRFSEKELARIIIADGHPLDNGTKLIMNDLVMRYLERGEINAKRKN